MMHELDPAQRRWAEQTEPERFKMPLAEIRTSAVKFRARVSRRNRIEYAAAALSAGVFLFYAFALPGGPVFKAGCVAAALGALLLAWNLHRRAGSARHTDVEQVAKSLAEFHRAQLVRQRDALRSVLTWYLAPLAPGLALLLLGAALDTVERFGPLIAFGGQGLLATVIAGAYFYIWRLNRKAANALQAEIDDIDAIR